MALSPEQRKKMREVGSRKAHIRTSDSYFFPIGSTTRGLIVHPEHKSEFWKLHSMVVGKILKAHPYVQPGLMSHIVRQLAVMPDRTTLKSLEKVLRGRKPTEIKKFPTHLALCETFFQLTEHRNAVRERLNKEKKIPWHET